MALRKFRWSINGGTSWTVEEQNLPFNLSAVGETDTVLIEPIGSLVSNMGIVFDIYVNPLIGSNAFPGTFEQPKATIAAAVATGANRIGIVRGSIIRERLNLSGISGKYVGAYGVGDNPLLIGSVRHTSGWTNVSGTIWEKDIGYTAVNCFIWAGGENVTKFIVGTFASLTAGQFGVSGNLIRVNSAISPNTLNIEIPVNGTLSVATGVYTDGANNTIRNIRCWFWGANGLEGAAGSNNFLAVDGDYAYNSNDGAGIHGTTTVNARFINCRFKRNGQERGNNSTAAGDGLSFHDNSTGAIIGCIIIENEKEGIGNQPGTSVLMEFNTLKGNWQEYFVLTSGVTGKGEQDFRYNIVIFVAEGQTTATCALRVDPSTNRPNVRIYNNVIYCEGVATGNGLRVAGGDVIFINNIVKGFNRGIDYRSTDTNASLINSNNILHGNTTNYFTNGTPGVVAGANETIADPLFVNAAAGDFRLQAGSPCRGAGINVGLTIDKAGQPVPAIPDIGAYQFV